jgi:CRP/FNR family nitrogen fixation transcriptional regulator
MLQQTHNRRLASGWTPEKTESLLNQFLRLSVAGHARQELLKRALLAARRGPIRYRRNRVIVCDGDPAEYIFLVINGVVRRCRTYCNGARSIVAFHLADELFGWTFDASHEFSVEAATDATILFIKRDVLRESATQNIAMANFLIVSIASELQRIQKHALLIGRDARFRVASFFIDLATRTGRWRSIDLPMGHHDVADYLGLTIETLSRTITEFERAGLISRQSRHSLVLNDSSSLAQMLD